MSVIWFINIPTPIQDSWFVNIFSYSGHLESNSKRMFLLRTQEQGLSFDISLQHHFSSQIGYEVHKLFNEKICNGAQSLWVLTFTGSYECQILSFSILGCACLLLRVWREHDRVKFFSTFSFQFRNNNT
jgi:hypothetical protein